MKNKTQLIKEFDALEERLLSDEELTPQQLCDIAFEMKILKKVING